MKTKKKKKNEKKKTPGDIIILHVSQKFWSDHVVPEIWCAMHSWTDGQMDGWMEGQTDEKGDI